MPRVMPRVMLVVSFAALVASALAEAQTVGPPVEAASTSAATQGRIVQRGETLMSLSREWLDVLVAAGVPVTLSQVLIATYRANPDAFGRNMNDLKVGAIIRFPPAAAVQDISRREALYEVRSSLGIWSPTTSPTADATESIAPEPTPAPTPTPTTAAPAPTSVPAPTVTPTPESMVNLPALFEERLARIEAALAASQRQLNELMRRQAEAQTPRDRSATSFATTFLQSGWWIFLVVVALFAGIIVWRRRAQAETEETPESTSSSFETPIVATMPITLDSRTIEGGGGIGRRLLDLGPRPSASPIAGPLEDLEGDPPPVQEARSLIDLARAYLEMGEISEARQELSRAFDLGNEAEREEIRRLLDTLPSA